MPYYDGSGPEGFGPMTGRGFGSCAGQGFVPRGFGMGRGRGLRGGYGYRYFVPPVITQDEEIQMLKEDQKVLQEDLKNVEQRLKELSSK